MDLELTYKAEDGREITYTPKVTWDDLDEFFEEECEGTYIGSSATKFINLDKLFEDEDFIKWAHEHWKLDGMDELKRIEQEEKDEKAYNIKSAIEDIEYLTDEDEYAQTNIDEIIQKTAERYDLNYEELKQAYLERK